MEFGEGLELERSQEMPLATIEVKKLADGLGYGEGPISHADRTDVGEETLQKVESVIQNPEEILIEISRDDNGKKLKDDGCSDGRRFRKVVRGFIEKTKSLIRPKVFGGGATMVVASTIGLGEASGKSLQDLFSTTINSLNEEGVEFGAHTDNHSKESNCGCGAIDNAPAIIGNVVKYKEQITSTIENVLGIDSTGLDDIFTNYGAYAESIKDEPHAGAEVIGEILEADKVVKELDGPHLEKYIVLNNVKGYTVNQEKIRQVSGEKVQVFGVDIWRLQKLVQMKYPKRSAEDQQKAFLSEIVYSLATAATLTKGDLPVYVVSKRPEPVAA